MPLVKRLFFLLLFIASAASGQVVRIGQKPQGIVHGNLAVPIYLQPPAVRAEVLINNVKFSEARGPAAVVNVHIGEYLRRLRIRVIGYDAQNNVVGEDEMVVNDPRPPFRVHLQATPGQLAATIVKPADVTIAAVDFYVGEEKIATVTTPPYVATYKEDHAVYARVVARAANAEEANDVFFFGTTPSEKVDVTVQQIPVSIVQGTKPLAIGDLTLLDNGAPRKIEALVPAADQPLRVIMLIDYSESMIEEMPVVKAAAKSFAQALLRPNDRIAVVGFNQTLFWLTGFTNDFNAAAASIDRVKPGGETHLYDFTIEMLYELQKQPGRHALVIFTDGVDQGSTFTLDHLIHYARYAGVPIYPVIKNHLLTRLMHFGIGQVEARRLANVARDTGATYFIIRSDRDLPAVYTRIARELRDQYQLIFYSDPAAPDEWHPLRLDTRGGQQLRIPLGYFP